jgi:hypothetical protein
MDEELIEVTKGQLEFWLGNAYNAGYQRRKAEEIEEIKLYEKMHQHCASGQTIPIWEDA